MKKMFRMIAVCLSITLLMLSGCNLFGKDTNFAIKDTLEDGHGKKATVILLGGQSNASGCSLDEYLKMNVSEDQYNEYQNGYDNVYINYFVSGNNESREFVKCGSKQGENGVAFGPELGMAQKLHELYPDQMFFIIKYAWGGTNLFEQWRSPSSLGKTGDLYKSFVEFVNASVEYLDHKDYDIKIQGFCWMQGESDSFDEQVSLNYADNLSNLIKDVRNEFSKYSSNEGIAFIDAYIAALPIFWVYYENVNSCKKQVADSSPLNIVIDTNAEGLTTLNEPFDQPDIPHYDSMSQIRLGQLFIENLAQFL